MKPRLQTALGQHLVMTPQLRQAIRLLQLSAVELEAEMTEALESNPVLEWADEESPTLGVETPDAPVPDGEATPDERWDDAELDGWAERAPGSVVDDDTTAAEQVADSETLHDHLLWQLHLSTLSPRDRAIGVAVIEAISDDGYLREPLEAIVASLGEPTPSNNDVLTVLYQIQHFDPVGVGARTVAESLRIQLGVLDPETPGRSIALRIADGCLERLPRLGADGLASELGEPVDEVDAAIALLLSLDPRPGAQLGAVSAGAYVTPDVVISRQRGEWKVSLAEHGRPRLRINRGYEALAGRATAADAAYLRGHLQEARWLLKNLEARGDTLLRVTRCLVQRQVGFLEFGDGALRPRTLRAVAGELGLHESTISRAIARKYARTPRGTLPLRAFFASGVADGNGEETSSAAIQSMIRQLVAAENPRKPLSDAKLADTLRAGGVPVARRTVAKYREAMGIPSSQDRVRMG